ncbi:MAG: M48 family metallopeptidase [Proteobacteria bacterium]|nr:M48 family metallopeptidase [Pseudomonadota bacterium]
MNKFSAKFFDGLHIQAKIVLVEVTTQGLMIFIKDESGETQVLWPKESLQLMERLHQQKPAKIGCKTMLGARLVVENTTAYEAIFPLIPPKNIKLSHVHHPWRIVWMLMAACVLLLFMPLWHFPMVSLWIANIIPYSWEEDIWENEVKQRFVGTTECVSVDGRKALDKIVRKLEKGANTKHNFDVRVIDSPDFVNAESTPGFHIFVYSGLLKMDSPDAVAGVIAHEMGHSLKHHVIASFINEMGIRTFYNAVFGISNQNIAFDFLNLKFSRDFETQADKIAIDLVKKANISPKGFRESMEFLAKQSGEFEGLEAYLVDHPTHQERINLIKENENIKNSEPSLTASEWQSLKHICDKTRPMQFQATDQ